MSKKDFYDLRDIISKLKYIKEADTDKSASHDLFCELVNKGLGICDNNINKMKPIK